MFKTIRAGSPRSGWDIIAVHEGATRLPKGMSLDEASLKAARAGLKAPGFRGEAGEVRVIEDGLALLGLGGKDGVSVTRLETVGAKLIRALTRLEPKGVRLHLEALPESKLDRRSAGRALGEGIGLANWRVDFFDGTAAKTPAPLPALTIGASEKPVRDGIADGLVMAECANETRRMAATPPNICNPPWIAKEARRLAKKAGLTCRVINYTEAQRLGMGGIVNVGKGSAAKPCMVILEHKPARPKKGVTIALVGKTMTYDTGGYSLKISNGMKGMKYDGNGGCAVLGTMLAVAARKLPVHVVGLLPAAENMVSEASYRPDDIIEMYNGVSVEVTNTDAEGRLIMADALAYACEKYKPTAIIDTATLTGGVVVALGSWCAGLWCNDDDLLRRVENAGESTGERVWRLPLWEQHRDFMRAKHADIWNSGPKRDGHPIQGAAFLSYFVDEDVPWAHVDIAGVSAVEGDTPTFVSGPTGFGVRLLTETVASYA